MAEEKPETGVDEQPGESKDSGTESAGAAVTEAETVEAAPTETPTEDVGTESAGAAVTEADDVAASEPAVEEPAAPPEPPKKRKRLPRALRPQRAKPKRERSATRKPLVRTPKQESVPGRRQERRGVVVSDKGDKTIVVSVDVTKLHPQYGKVVRRSRKFHAHDEQNAAGIGDVVRIVETRPLSKTKDWRLAEILEKAK
jgi:small subunit ribosomal protein S17